ncbi:MAG: Magnetosome protein MmsF [Candidatus Yanofskybacteria bacterium GW2011_GWF1_44_227]|uniref:Magnetosome protein MmsF n=1 Tax=Candidatus Yanofskybacteria bacterium GW2011_GWE2_40_11 TaxID=1619033 RepID=A0A0G0QJZ1_9BACT|nr:MAG: Magnetosome protein MmsF [Candidatus Yanofskybacteria bacterium GW2011_GWE1_40_10]KKR40674.1 MAG: Magnetosome protein MmsF [Candidatus Yanofskybacteria bacterium GW2011_GWE2_40_11]KKT15765.1 MAG: Magnetosome protein MmsF [Candidatus Yanofskybacteria bacterium GW2011_GWF2_43_596]KKT53455.1 MAG: Magnetosome protein MmsF [Candidatus Yanofskybacteria bacterium GW2011_GWF1_44_227]OGN35864.1 MAG: hypothetical protein A2241_03735 [Candidatus Yanofskybacteria bacterium RIFOXYA2_FULL_45_28]OGN3
MGILCYLSFLVFIPFVTAKDNEFIKFHAKQGLGVFSLEVIGWILGFMPGVHAFSLIISVVTLILSIIGIVNVLNNRTTPLPIANQISDLLNL